MTWENQPPQNESFAAFLARRWGVPIAITHQIVEGAKGNIRTSRADLEMLMGRVAVERAGGRTGSREVGGRSGVAGA